MTYEYTCVECKHAWTEQQSIKAAATTCCPRCKRQAAQRVINARGGFMVRGGHGPHGEGHEQIPNRPPDFWELSATVIETRDCAAHGAEFRVVGRESVTIPGDALPAPAPSKDLNLRFRSVYSVRHDTRREHL
jgi:putative FmdB family regulatory protein